MKKYSFLLFVLVSLSISAQNISTGYHSNSFGLRSSSNPSAFPETKFVLGFPGLSNLNIGLQIPLSLNESLVVGSDDSLRISLPKIMSNLMENNQISHSLRNQLFHIGMKVGAKKKVFIYMGDELVLDAGIQFSDKFINYLFKGNAAFLNQQMSFDAQKLQFTSYNSFYLGSAVKINKDLEVGARIKFLHGIANVTFDKLNLGFYTDSTSSPIYTTTVSSDIMILSSGQGAIDDTLEFDPMKNSGFAVDIGASYKFTEKFSASIALNDIGAIDWEESNNKFYTTKGVVDFEFSGLTQSSTDAEDLEVQMEEIVDSIITIMEPQQMGGAYSTRLNPNMFLGLSYILNSKHSFSGLYHRRKSIDKVLNTISLGYQYNLGKSIQLLASGQFINGVSTLASGFVWSPGVVQMHLILDNILAADVFDTKSLFIQFGVSFHFGK